MRTAAKRFPTDLYLKELHFKNCCDVLSSFGIGRHTFMRAHRKAPALYAAKAKRHYMNARYWVFK